MFTRQAALRLVSVALLSATAAMPAKAVTVILGGANGNLASASYAAGGIDFTVTARKFTVAPNSLANIAQFTGNGLVSRTMPGLGVAGGASSPQIDTNQPTNREALIVSASQPIKLSALKLSYVDGNDTLQVYGINGDGTLTSLGFGGRIQNGLGGLAAFANSGANSGTTQLTLNTLSAGFTAFVFTTRVGGDVNFGGDLGQGYRLDALSVEAVPEPATWAMFIAGFGLVGAAVRRRPQEA